MDSGASDRDRSRAIRLLPVPIVGDGGKITLFPASVANWPQAAFSRSRRAEPFPWLARPTAKRRPPWEIAALAPSGAAAFSLGLIAKRAVKSGIANTFNTFKIGRMARSGRSRITSIGA
jgi:hypothetical protein